MVVVVLWMVVLVVNRLFVESVVAVVELNV